MAAFIPWLRQQARRDDAIGDLARDVREDDGVWRNMEAADLRARMLELNACPRALDTLDRAVAEFRGRP